jgi:hypothetical protein
MTTKFDEEQLTPEEKQALKEYLGLGAAMPDEKHNVHSFLSKVKTDEDTTRVGNLTADEVGIPLLTLRTHKELALISDKIIGNDFFKEYYNQRGQILTATSLSKDAKLINLAVIQKRQIEDVTKPKVENKGWFKKKETQPEQQQVV